MKQPFHEAIQVFNSETMKKYWNKFTKASTEGKAIKKRSNKKRFHCTWEPKPKRAWRAIIEVKLKKHEKQRELLRKK